MLSPAQFNAMSQRQRVLAGLASLTPARDALDVRAAAGARVGLLAMPSWQKSMTQQTLTPAAVMPAPSDSPVNRIRGLGNLTTANKLLDEAVAASNMQSTPPTANKAVANVGTGGRYAASIQRQPAAVVQTSSNVVAKASVAQEAIAAERPKANVIAPMMDTGRSGAASVPSLGPIAMQEQSRTWLWVAGAVGLVAVGAFAYFTFKD